MGVITGLISCILQVFPTGDALGKYTAHNQPTAIAGMEGLFHSEKGAPLVILGQPNVEQRANRQPSRRESMLSFLIYGTPTAEVPGLDAFPRQIGPRTFRCCITRITSWPAWEHAFVALMALAAFLLWRGKLFTTRSVLWALMLSFPFPYIANTAGWMAAELGRQPWLVYGLMRTQEGYSANVLEGNTLFTLLGFMGLYALLSVLFILLMYREVDHGPDLVSPTGSYHASVPVHA